MATAYRVPGARSIRWRLGGIAFGPFLGGLNLRDTYTEIQPNELAAETNFTLDERGWAVKINACPASASFPTPPGAVLSAYYSQALAVAVIQVGGQLYKAAIGAGAWTAFGIATHASSLGGMNFADFAGKLTYVESPGIQAAYKVWTYDGVTETLAATLTATSPSTAHPPLVVWQNKLWIGGGSQSSGSGVITGLPNLYWSAAGNAASWTNATDFVSIREKDDKPITALFAMSGLIVCKGESMYRVNDSTTGVYQTIDWQVGCRTATSLCGADGKLYLVATDGLYASNGVGPAVNVGDKLRPIWQSAGVPTATTITAQMLNGRAYFAYQNATNDTVKNGIIEYNPRVGWLMRQGRADSPAALIHFRNALNLESVTFFSSVASQALDLYPDSIAGRARSAFTCSLQTGYAEPFGGYPGRITKADPKLIAPVAASAPLTFTIYYVDLGSASQTWSDQFTYSATGLIPLVRHDLRPKMVGTAFSVGISDAVGALTDLTFEACDLSALLTALR